MSIPFSRIPTSGGSRFRRKCGRPKTSPCYHLFAENADTEYVAYVSEQNLLPDTTGDPVRHPQVEEMFTRAQDGGYHIKIPRLN